MSRILLRTRFGVLRAFVTTLYLISATAVAEMSSGATGPELPRLYVDTAYVPPSGRTLAVRAGEDFQAALNAAQPGDVITLEAGATFLGSFTLPNKPGSRWIIVRTSAPDSSLPPPGTRLGPLYASVMPKLVAASGSVLTTAPGAHHYRFIGIEVRPSRISKASSWRMLEWIRSAIRRGTWSGARGVLLYNLVHLGTTETSVDKLPHHIIFDRCYLHGDPKKGTRRGIAMNSGYTAVIDSYLSDFKEVGADSQAIAGWNGSGPFKIVNNYLEGAGENVMFGGADPSILDLVPSDVEIRRNHFSKPLSWKVGEPAYEGMPWTIKNLFELKNARRVLIEGNLFEHNWVHAQSGFAILFTVRNQDGSSPWSVVEDVTFINNVVRHTAAGINILGWDNIHPSQQTKRILIKNNLFDDVGDTRWGGGGRLFQLLRGTADVVIDYNTAFQTENVITAEGTAHTGFVYCNNITPHNSYGIIGTGTAPGNHTLTAYFPGAVVKKNVMAGGHAAQYPPDNFFPPSLDEVGFVDRAGGDYRLVDSSPYKHAGTDGKDVGVDFDALSEAMATSLKPQTQLSPRYLTERGG